MIGKLALGTSALVLPLVGVSGVASATGEDEVRETLLPSAVEDTTNDTATLPIAPGIDADGQEFWYVVTEASDKKLARRLGVNESRKLENAADTDASQQGRFVDGVLHLEATVDFSPERVVVGDPETGFPPLEASPGSVGEVGYSPLVALPDGTVLNAPHVANDTGVHDKAVGGLDVAEGVGTFQESEGFYDGDEIYYISFDASAPDIAALEGATYAPELNAAPGLGSNKNDSARSGIAPFTNGQTGVDNPNRQGLNSALLGEGDPLNVTETLAGQRDYSPLWDVHATTWSDAAIAAGDNVVQTDFEDIIDLAEDNIVTAPGGAEWGASGVIVNCPIISIEE